MVSGSARLLCLAAAGLLASCTLSTVPDPPTEDPLVEPLPYTVGVYYDPDFRSFEFISHYDPVLSMKYEIGSPSVEMFDHALSSLFEEVVVIEEWPANATLDPEVVGVFYPRIENFYGGIDTGWQGRYYANVTYRTTLYDSLGEEVGSWTVYGRGEVRQLSFVWQGAGEVTGLALREAGARFLAGFRKEPAVIRWLERLQRPDAARSQSAG